MFHNCPEFLESFYALQKLGAIPSPLNYRFTPREIEYQTNQSDSIIFLTEEICLESVRKAKPNMPKVKNYICAGREVDDTLNYEELIKKYPAVEPEVDVSMEDACTLSYTAGTTGRPKGVMLTYNNVMSALKGIVGILPSFTKLELPDLKFSIFGLQIPIKGSTINPFLRLPSIEKILSSYGADLLLDVIPLVRGHLPPLGFLLPLPLYHGGSAMARDCWWIQLGLPLMLTTNPRFDPKEVLEIIDKLKPFGIVLVPAMWSKVLEVPDLDKYDKSSLVIISTGAAPCPVSLKRRILEEFFGIMIDGFGQTETVSATSLRLDSPLQAENLKRDSVGKPIFGLEVRVFNEQGEEVKQGEVGEIVYKGEMVAKGYYKEDERTSEAMKDGWFHSGDLGYIDEAGEIRVLERITETINFGGEKIHPSEVERILEENPKVERACLIGVPDEVLGEVPRSVIQLRKGKEATEDEIIEWCRGKMAGYKRPKSVLFVKELPLTPIGKVMRKAVIEKCGR